MVEHIQYNDRKFTLYSYYTKTERDLILTANSDTSEEKNYDLYLRVLESNIKSNINIFNLEPEEKLFLLYRLRSSSVSDILNLNVSCECGNNFKASIDINKIHNFKEINNKELNNIYSNNFKDYFKKNPDDYSLLEYEKLEDYIIENKTSFKFNFEFKCPACKKNNEIDLSSPGIFKNIFSENDIIELYKSITRLSYNGKFTINGILNDLYPFEREIFINMINTEVEEYNKTVKNKQQF